MADLVQVYVIMAQFDVHILDGRDFGQGRIAGQLVVVVPSPPNSAMARLNGVSSRSSKDRVASRSLSTSRMVAREALRVDLSFPWTRSR